MKTCWTLALIFFCFNLGAAPLFTSGTWKAAVTPELPVVGIFTDSELQKVENKGKISYHLLPTLLANSSFAVPGTENRARLCPSDFFSLNEKVNLTCTGVLLDEETVLTASHCARPQNRRYLRFVPGHTGERELKEEDVFLAKVARAHSYLDFTIIKLDRKVSQKFRFFKFSQDSAPAAGTQLCLEGFPLGLNQRYQSCTNEVRVTEHYLATALSSFQGQSGSPVFSQDEKGEKTLWGILVASNTDFHYNKEQNCLEILSCQNYVDCHPSYVLKSQSMSLAK